MAQETPHAVGLVLSGGGTRLFAHIGFLWALEDAGLLAPGEAPVSAVVGNSAGSLVGTMLALGYAPHEMWETAYWRVWGYSPPAEPRAWRADPKPRGLELAVDLDFDGLAHALTDNINHFKGIDTGLRFEALLARTLERQDPDGQPNPYFGGTRPPEADLPLYLIGFNLTNRRETVFRFGAHCPHVPLPPLAAYRIPGGREASYEVCCDRDNAASPKEHFRPWEGVRISTSLPLVFRPYYKPRFVSTHWDEQGQPYQLIQGAYFSDGGTRDNYSLSAAIKLANCDAVLGCFLGDPAYPYETIGQGTMIDLVMRNIDGMMQTIFEADQDDAEIIARPVRTVVPHIESRPGVTFDLSQIGAVMEAGYIAAAYYLRRLCADIPDDRQFLAMLVAGRIRLTWNDALAPGEETWGPAVHPVGAPGPVSNYFIIRPPAEFQALANRFFAEQYPARPEAMAAPPPPLDEEIAHRNRERQEVAPSELDDPPFRDMPLTRQQRAIVAWSKRISWAAASGIIGGLGSALLAVWAVAGHALHLLPALDPTEMWVAELLVLIAAAGIGWLVRGVAVQLLWEALKKQIRQRVGFH